MPPALSGSGQDATTVHMGSKIFESSNDMLASVQSSLAELRFQPVQQSSSLHWWPLQSSGFVNASPSGSFSH